MKANVCIPLVPSRQPERLLIHSRKAAWRSRRDRTRRGCSWGWWKESWKDKTGRKKARLQHGKFRHTAKKLRLILVSLLGSLHRKSILLGWSEFSANLNMRVCAGTLRSSPLNLGIIISAIFSLNSQNPPTGWGYKPLETLTEVSVILPLASTGLWATPVFCILFLNLL